MGESSSTVELQIGGVATPELVWWSWSPPKHALNPSFKDQEQPSQSTKPLKLLLQK
jgi:hypothetical protein